MAPLYYCPAIVYASTTWYMPPWLRAQVSRSQSVEIKNPPKASRAVITSVNRNQGTTISLTMDCLHDTPSETEVLATLEEIWTHFSGEDKLFTFFEWSDRGWPECALQTFDYEHGLSPFQMLQGAGLTLVSAYSEPDTNLQLTFDDYDVDYPYANKVGRPVGTAVVPGTVTPVNQAAIQSLPGMFSGVVDTTTAAGQEHRFRVGGETGRQWKLEGIQISSAEPSGASGTTTVRVATYPVGGTPGSHLQASVAAAAYFGSEATGSITVTTGDTLYVSCQAAGGHQNVQYRVRLKAL